MDHYFAVSAPGIAPYTARELQSLKLLPPALVGAGAGRTPQQEDGDRQGGVAFGGDKAALYLANLHLRTANRVLLRLGDFPAVGFAELRKRAARLPWERCLSGGQAVALRVTCHKSRLYHSDAVAERVAGAIADRLGQAPGLRKYDEDSDAPTPDAPPQLVVVRMLHDHCTISVDSSGELLHRRGYRLATAKAPLRETLAAALLLASGWWEAAQTLPPPLLDPFCGSGTIAIEAAQMALGIAAGLGGERPRRFAFMSWPDYDAALWDQLAAQAQAQAQRRTEEIGGKLAISGSDRDAGAVAMAAANAARAGVAAHLAFTRRTVSEIAPCCPHGWIVTNPPYGLRVGASGDLRNLYAQFGSVLQGGFRGWQVAVLSSDPNLLRQMRLELDTRTRFVNGGVAVTCGRGRVA